MTEEHIHTWRGLRMWASTDRRGVTRYSLDKRQWHPTPRDAVRLAHLGEMRIVLDEDGVQLLRRRPKHQHEGVFGAPSKNWILQMTDPECFETGAVRFEHRPSAFDISMYRARARARLPDRQARTELGWRAWETTMRSISPTAKGCFLISPHQMTEWPEAELRVPRWSTSSAVRGSAGIHARRMPRDWRLAGWFADGHAEGPAPSRTLVHGIVERFGRFVLGTTGWRAEWVIIRELEAPTPEIAAGLRLTYPEVIVHLKGDYST